MCMCFGPRVTCRVHQLEIHQTRDSEIYLPGSFNQTPGLAVSMLHYPLAIQTHNIYWVKCADKAAMKLCRFLLFYRNAFSGSISFFVITDGYQGSFIVTIVITVLTTLTATVICSCIVHLVKKHSCPGKSVSRRYF